MYGSTPDEPYLVFDSPVSAAPFARSCCTMTRCRMRLRLRGAPSANARVLPHSRPTLAGPALLTVGRTHNAAASPAPARARTLATRASAARPYRGGAELLACACGKGRTRAGQRAPNFIRSRLPATDAWSLQPTEVHSVSWSCEPERAVFAPHTPLCYHAKCAWNDARTQRATKSARENTSELARPASTESIIPFRMVHSHSSMWWRWCAGLLAVSLLQRTTRAAPPPERFFFPDVSSAAATEYNFTVAPAVCATAGDCDVVSVVPYFTINGQMPGARRAAGPRSAAQWRYGTLLADGSAGCGCGCGARQAQR